MKLKELQKIDEKYCKCHYFINYILTNNDVEFNDYNYFYLDTDFYYTLYFILESDKINNLYSKEIHDRLGTILKYIESNCKIPDLDLFNKIKDIYSSVKDNNGYELYNQELLAKYDTIDSNLKTKPLLWNKKDIHESFKFDFVAIMSFDLKNIDDQIIGNYVFNINYLLFIKKLLSNYPSIILNKKYKNKILNILQYNNINNEYKDNKFFIKTFIEKNYDQYFDDETKNKIYNKFVNLNKDLLVKISNLNKKNYNDRFYLETFEKVYYESILEKMIILNSQEELDYTNINILDYLYDLINYYVCHNQLNIKMKNNILDIMSMFRYSIKEIDIKKHNEFIVLVNSAPIYENVFKYSYIQNKLGKKEFNEFFKKPYVYIVDEFMQTLDLDNKFFESLLSDNYEEDYLKHFIYNDDYVGTINRYLIEYTSLFYNKEIHDRVEQTFTAIIEEYKKENLCSKEKYEENLKTLKKINKLYYGKR